MTDRLREQSYEPMTTTPAEWGPMIRRETRRVRAVADAAGIRPQSGSFNHPIEMGYPEYIETI